MRSGLRVRRLGAIIRSHMDISAFLSPELLDDLVGRALGEARLAATEGEVPVGAVIWSPSDGAQNQGLIVAQDHNRVEQLRDATSHAEMLVLKAAAKASGNWRLTNCVLAVTLEPCVMCLGALRLARIPAVIFGAGDSRFGALGSVYNLAVDDRSGPAPKIFSGIRKEECVDLLKAFFAARR